MTTSSNFSPSPAAIALSTDKRLLRFFTKEKISFRKRLRTALEFSKSSTKEERQVFYFNYREQIYDCIRHTIVQYESLKTDEDYVKDKNEKTGFMSKLGLKKRIGIDDWLDVFTVLHCLIYHTGDVIAYSNWNQGGLLELFEKFLHPKNLNAIRRGALDVLLCYTNVVSDCNNDDLRHVRLLQEVVLRGFDSLIMDNSTEDHSIVAAAVKEESNRQKSELGHRDFFESPPLESLSSTQPLTLSHHLTMLGAVLAYAACGCIEEKTNNDLGRHACQTNPSTALSSTYSTDSASSSVSSLSSSRALDTPMKTNYWNGFCLEYIFPTFFPFVSEECGFSPPIISRGLRNCPFEVQKVFDVFLDDLVAAGNNVLDVFWSKRESGLVIEETLRQRFENISTGERIECEEKQAMVLRTMHMYTNFLEETGNVPKDILSHLGSYSVLFAHHSAEVLLQAQTLTDYRHYSALIEGAVSLFEQPLEKAMDAGKGESFQQLLLHVIAHVKLKVNSIGIEHMTRLIRCLFKMSAQNSDCSDKSVEQQAAANLREYVKNSQDDTMSAVVVKEWRQQLIDLTKVVIWHIEVGNDGTSNRKMTNSRWSIGSTTWLAGQNAGECAQIMTRHLNMIPPSILNTLIPKLHAIVVRGVADALRIWLHEAIIPERHFKPPPKRGAGKDARAAAKDRAKQEDIELKSPLLKIGPSTVLNLLGPWLLIASNSKDPRFKEGRSSAIDSLMRLVVARTFSRLDTKMECLIFKRVAVALEEGATNPSTFASVIRQMPEIFLADLPGNIFLISKFLDMIESIISQHLTKKTELSSMLIGSQSKTATLKSLSCALSICNAYKSLSNLGSHRVRISEIIIYLVNHHSSLFGDAPCLRYSVMAIYGLILDELNHNLSNLKSGKGENTQNFKVWTKQLTDWCSSPSVHASSAAIDCWKNLTAFSHKFEEICVESLSPTKIVQNFIGITWELLRGVGNRRVADFLDGERAAVALENACSAEAALSNSNKKNANNNTIATIQITSTKVDDTVSKETTTTLRKLSERRNTELEAPEHHREKIRRNLKQLGLRSTSNKKQFERQHSPSFSHHRGGAMDNASSSHLQTDHTETNFDDLLPTTTTTVEKVSDDSEVAGEGLGCVRKETVSVPFMHPPAPKNLDGESDSKSAGTKDKSFKDGKNDEEKLGESESEGARLSTLHTMPSEFNLFSESSMRNIQAVAKTIKPVGKKNSLKVIDESSDGVNNSPAAQKIVALIRLVESWSLKNVVVFQDNAVCLRIFEILEAAIVGRLEGWKSILLEEGGVVDVGKLPMLLQQLRNDNCNHISALKGRWEELAPFYKMIAEAASESICHLLNMLEGSSKWCPDVIGLHDASMIDLNHSSINDVSVHRLEQSVFLSYMNKVIFSLVHENHGEGIVVARDMSGAYAFRAHVENLDQANISEHLITKKLKWRSENVSFINSLCEGKHWANGDQGRIMSSEKMNRGPAWLKSSSSVSMTFGVSESVVDSVEKNRSTGSVISYDPTSLNRVSREMREKGAYGARAGREDGKVGVKVGTQEGNAGDDNFSKGNGRERNVDDEDYEVDEDDQSFVFGQSDVSDFVPPPPSHCRESEESAPPPPPLPPLMDSHGVINLSEEEEVEGQKVARTSLSRRQMLLKRMNSIHEAHHRSYAEVTEDYDLSSDNMTLLMDGLSVVVDDPTLLGGRKNIGTVGEIRIDCVDTMERVLVDPWMSKALEKMLKKEFAAESYNFWDAVENGYKKKRVPKAEGDRLKVMTAEASRIYERFIKEGADEQINIPSGMVEEIEKCLVATGSESCDANGQDAMESLFDAANKEVIAMLASDKLGRFLKLDEVKERVGIYESTLKKERDVEKFTEANRKARRKEERRRGKEDENRGEEGEEGSGGGVRGKERRGRNRLTGHYHTHGKFDATRLFTSQIGFLQSFDSRDFKLLRTSDGRSFRNLVSDIQHLDATSERECMKIGVLYVSNGQDNQKDILANKFGSADYERFVDNLGKKVDIATHRGFNGKMDKKGQHGKHFIYFGDNDVEVAFHVATRMPTSDSDVQQLNKKKHIGNDFVHVVWSESKRDYRPMCISSEFNDVVITIYPQGRRKNLYR